MTPSDVFALPSIRETHQVNCLCGFWYNHLPEIDEVVWQTIHGNKGCLGDFEGYEGAAQSERITIKEHGFYTYDHRRIWRVASVWLDDRPVMIIRNAGREGDDHKARWVVDEEAYAGLLKEVVSLANPHPQKNEDFVDRNKDIGDVFDFYGHKIDAGRETPYASLDFF